jgi:hypothetical protein
MTPADLDKLLRIRRQREENAMQAALARREALARAEAEAAEAAAAAAEHARQSLDRERMSLTGLLGQTLHPRDLVNLQSNLNARADEHRHLVADEQAAIGQREGCEADYEAARAEYRRRHGQSEKLSELITHERTKASRRQLILSEAASDEGYLPGGPAHAIPEDGDAR